MQKAKQTWGGSALSVIGLFRVVAEVIGWGGLPDAIKVWGGLMAYFPEWIAIILVFLGFAIIAHANWGSLRRIWARKPKVVAGDEFASPQEAEGAIPLKDAARIALEAIDGSIFTTAARQPHMAPNGPLCFMADRLFCDAMPIYGKHVPSTQLILIPDTALFGNEFAKDATVIEDQYSHEVIYADMEVRRQDLSSAIESLKERHVPSKG